MQTRTVVQHFVEYLSPGTLVSEERTEGPFDQLPTVAQALERAGGVTERYGAKPYAFRFVTTTAAEGVEP